MSLGCHRVSHPIHPCSLDLKTMDPLQAEEHLGLRFKDSDSGLQVLSLSVKWRMETGPDRLRVHAVLSVAFVHAFSASIQG